MEESGPQPDQEPESFLDAAALQVQLYAAQHELALVERESQAARDREALLRNELQHQVRNMLAIVRSVFSRTVAVGGTVEDIAHHFQGRLDAISRYQVARSRDPAGVTDLERILRDELQSFQFGDDPMIEISGPEVGVRNEVAHLMALALHELATNSIKFGVLAGADDRGRLETSWTFADGVLHFHWIETGVPVVTQAPVRRGFGREFIEDALPFQLGAETRFELRPGGVHCAISVAIDSAQPSRDRHG